jgi:hypothetical protein
MTDTLILPKRYETLQQVAEKQDADLTQIVRKIPDATARIEQLMRQVENGGLGRFELFLGASGSGKTTFLSTLPRFYTGAKVIPIPATVDLLDLPDEIRRRGEVGLAGQVFVLLDRDNPELDDQQVRKFFDELRKLFRTPEGKALVVWPITDKTSAAKLAAWAWEVGSDSVVDLGSKGTYNFTGLPKGDYYDVADVTTRSLNGGQSLEAFGLGPGVAAELLPSAETISQYYGNLEAKSQQLNNKIGDTLKERRVPAIWILVSGDDVRELSLSVANLTQGTEKRVDIDRMISVLDEDDSSSGYLGDWRKRRDQIAFLLRHLDVRIFELTPNVALSAVRAFADNSIRSHLQKKKDSRSNAVRAVQGARFFQTLAGTPQGKASTIRAATQEARKEYRRIQKLASSSDKALNKALAKAIESALADVGVSGTVTAERQNLDPKSALKPDVMVDLADGRLVCIEPTWRSGGAAIGSEFKKQQSTMTVGHIQQYLLSKVLDYVRDLGL